MPSTQLIRFTTLALARRGVNIEASGVLSTTFNRETRVRLADCIQDGHAVVIPDAFPEDVAERAHAELVASEKWRLHAACSDFFHYRHHNIYDEAELPPYVRSLKAEFASEESKRFAEYVSDCDCSGPPDFGASWYQPGDHSLPHQDYGLGRSVAWVWNLTKNWDPRWGGCLFWCPTGSSVLPQFNCLTLFKVTCESSHFVTTVADESEGRRLALNGWWTRKDALSIGLAEVESERTLGNAGYGDVVREQVCGRTLIVL